MRAITPAAASALPATLPDLDRIRAECRAMVKKRAALSAGATLIPLPGLDIGTDMSLLIELIPAINRKFGLTPEQIEHLDPQIKKIILVAVTSVGSELIGRMVTKQIVLALMQRIGLRFATKSVTRFVPIVGQALSAGLSFGAMRLLGNSHIDDCYAVVQGVISPTANVTTPAGKRTSRKPVRE